MVVVQDLLRNLSSVNLESKSHRQRIVPHQLAQATVKLNRPVVVTVIFLQLNLIYLLVIQPLDDGQLRRFSTLNDCIVW